MFCSLARSSSSHLFASWFVFALLLPAIVYQLGFAVGYAMFLEAATGHLRIFFKRAGVLLCCLVSLYFKLYQVWLASFGPVCCVVAIMLYAVM